MMLTALAALVLTGSTPHVTAQNAFADEVLLTETEQTLPAHSLRLSDDNLVWLGARLGATDRLELSLNGALLPVPLAGGLVVPFIGLGVAGGAGIGAVGGFDLGVKYHLVDQQGAIPGVALGYDFVDGYVAGAGIGGLAIAGGGGAGAVVAPAAGWVNAQLNLLYAVAGYDLGTAHVSLGALVVDNHHLLPQSARFGAVAVAVGEGAAAVPTGSGTELDELPTELFPYASASLRVGETTTLLMEVVGAHGFMSPVATTGARWSAGKPGRYVQLQAAAVWFYLPANQDHSTPMVGALPWLGVGGTFG